MAAILVALVITAIFYQITVGRRPAQAEIATKTLVVARAELPLGSVISADDITVVEFPAQGYPQGGFENIEDVVDRSITQPILANEPVTLGRVTEKGAGFGLAPLIPEGYRAVAIAVNQVSGVSGFILPGSKVDVLLSATLTGDADRLTTTVLENVTVLSTGQKQQPSANGQPENVPVINMLLTPEDAELLTLATQEGRIQLVLRNPKDESETAEDRAAKTSRDLFRKVLPPKAPARAQASPRPAPRKEPEVVVMEPPAPKIFEIEMIRGNKRSVEPIEQSKSQN
ncbi:MAG: Flp pilus assembly protein CpaB [Acidobacteria bacterium]|nr:Flp pilus assembly protein CpaB [Acidobacteriota bacterium]